MRKKRYTLFITGLIFIGTTSCSDWLEVYPQNDQVSDQYWTSKEDVDAVLNSGYFYLRDMVQTLIELGELRGGCLYNTRGSHLQEFRIEPEDSYCNWGGFYEIINVANTVIANAHKAKERDDTYDENVMNSHIAEAYFLRSLAYFYLVRNWKNVPLILEPYESDENPYLVTQSDESEVIAQIKDDLAKVIASGTAKEEFDKAWENKGRGTKWAMCALMADICLWSEEYEKAIHYCNIVLEAKGNSAPRFLSTPTHGSWFAMFNPGNSDESVLELQWSYEDEQTNSLPQWFNNDGGTYQYTPMMVTDFNDEYRHTQQNMKEAVRTMYGGYWMPSPSSYEVATTAYVWKYIGSQVLTDKRTSEYYDVHFILYRVAEVMLMKAEALVLKENGNIENYRQATDLMNRIRQRSNLDALPDPEGKDQQEMLSDVLHERRMELAGEAKTWYDLLRFGRRNNNQYKEAFLMAYLLDYNNSVSTSWLRSVLINDEALFLPVWETELKTNDLLIQNPYYQR